MHVLAINYENNFLPSFQLTNIYAEAHNAAKIKWQVIFTFNLIKSTDFLVEYGTAACEVLYPFADILWSD